MDKEIRLPTERLLIRTLRLEDISEAYIRGLQDPEVLQYLFDARFVTQTRATLTQFVQSNIESPHAILFGLFLRSEECIGTIRVWGISPIHFSCNLGICIFQKEYWNLGLGTEAVSKVVEYLFKEMGLHYVEAGAYRDHIGSLSLFKKAGFRVVAQFEDKFRYETDFKPVAFLGRKNEQFDFNKLKK